MGVGSAPVLAGAWHSGPGSRLTQLLPLTGFGSGTLSCGRMGLGGRSASVAGDYSVIPDACSATRASPQGGDPPAGATALALWLHSRAVARAAAWARARARARALSCLGAPGALVRVARCADAGKRTLAALREPRMPEKGTAGSATARHTEETNSRPYPSPAQEPGPSSSCCTRHGSACGAQGADENRSCGACLKSRGCVACARVLGGGP